MISAAQETIKTKRKLLQRESIKRVISWIIRIPEPYLSAQP